MNTDDQFANARKNMERLESEANKLGMDLLKANSKAEEDKIRF